MKIGKILTCMGFFGTDNIDNPFFRQFFKSHPMKSNRGIELSVPDCASQYHYINTPYEGPPHPRRVGIM